MTVSAILEPCYEIGGDAFDYTVDGSLARFMVYDAVGHGLTASLVCAAALSAVRAARRDGHGLYAMARAADSVVLEHFRDGQFVTAILAELNLDTGTVRYLNAGHPPPLVLRAGKVVRELRGGRRLPLGLDDPSIEVAEEKLEPGDHVLLYTDGIIEARSPAGQQFGLDRLIDLAERGTAQGLPASEKLRRLCHSVIEHQHAPARDDATLMLIEWSPVAARRNIPTATCE